MVGGNGTDTLNITTALTATIDGDTDLVTFENVVLAGTANITLTGQTEVLNITGGTGANTIIGGNGVDTITAGLAADIITGGAALDVFNFAAGDSAVTIGGSGSSGTIAGFDSIMDIVAGSGSAVSETVNVGGTAALAAAAAVNGTDSTLVIGSKAVKSHSVSAAGLATFDDADIFSAAGTVSLTNAGSIAATIQYLQANDIGGAGTTIGIVVADNSFGIDIGSVAEMILYTQGDATGSDNSLDQVVYLYNGGGIDALITTNGTGANDLFIA
jgi:Ca2+-binding RTX toxin-like protein